MTFISEIIPSTISICDYSIKCFANESRLTFPIFCAVKRLCKRRISHRGSRNVKNIATISSAPESALIAAITGLHPNRSEGEKFIIWWINFKYVWNNIAIQENDWLFQTYLALVMLLSVLFLPVDRPKDFVGFPVCLPKIINVITEIIRISRVWS